jgi:hypothetical protein
MANSDTNSKAARRGLQLSPLRVFGLVALLAPLSYFLGRLTPLVLANGYVAFWASGVSAAALGTMIGIPLGLFFGSLKGQPETTAPEANSTVLEQDILHQIRVELIEDQALFEARKGSTTMYARIEYLTSFWESIKASGRLFVLQDTQLLATIGTAYYWLDQASHLETLAYQAKYAAPADTTALQAERLIAEVRLLDGQLEATLATAVTALNSAITTP